MNFTEILAIIVVDDGELNTNLSFELRELRQCMNSNSAIIRAQISREETNLLPHPLHKCNK